MQSHPNAWLNKDIRRLRTVHATVLDDSSSEVAQPLLLEVRQCELRLASACMCATEGFLLSLARQFWSRRTLSRYLSNSLQNFVYGTDLEPGDCLDQLDEILENTYLLAFRVEELLCELKRMEIEAAPGRKSSTSEWLRLASASRTVLERALRVSLDEDESCAAVRKEIEVVLHVVARPSPGSFLWSVVVPGGRCC
jgi:hypothetical protein